jgi:hypothetical protein
MTVFSIFNIGTGHTSSEKNNIMKVLYDRCQATKEYKYLNDGPTGLDAVAGTGMEEKRRQTFQAIVNTHENPKLPFISRVNLTGHSRGAILCHMIAYDILTRTDIKEVNMFVIDPVHMSAGHTGADRLVSSSRLKSYQAIIMENVNKRIYPLTLVDADDRATKEKRYFIPMPGTHGSATQVLTNPIAQVAYELIANFLQKRGTDLGHTKKSPEEMCDLFAKIHLQNPLNAKGERLIYDDGGNVRTHVPGNYGYQPIKRRQEALAEARRLNQKFGGGRVKLSSLHEIPYFFNQKHAKFFKDAYPTLWKRILGRQQWDNVCEAQARRLRGYNAMRRTYHLLEPYLYADS